MLRHQWAMDRMWEGLMAPSDERFLAGASAFAEAPLEPSSVVPNPTVSDALRPIADRAHALGRNAAARDDRRRAGERLRRAALDVLRVPLGDPVRAQQPLSLAARSSSALEDAAELEIDRVERRDSRGPFVAVRADDDPASLLEREGLERLQHPTRRAVAPLFREPNRPSRRPRDAPARVRDVRHTSGAERARARRARGTRRRTP